MTNSKPKIRVLSISKPYVAAAYRQKFRYLAEDPRFEIGLITGSDWAGQKFEPLAGENYWLRTLDIALNGKNHFHYYKGLAKAMAEFKPDIVNIEEEHYSFVTYQAIREAKKLGAKSLFYTWQNIDKSYPPPFSWIESYVFRNSAYTVAGNQESLDILRKKGFHGPAEVIPQMGADAEAIERSSLTRTKFRQDMRAQLKIPESALTLMFAGRWVEEKGIQDAFAAISKLRGEGHTIHLMLLGGGPFEGQLKAKAQELGLGDLVHWIGPVPSLKIYDYMGVADVLLLSSHTRSNWKEQFGRVLVEAMLSGTVPIGSNSGEIPFVISEGGLVHKEQDSEDLARCIKLLDTDREKLRELSDLGRRRVEKHYTNRVIAAKYGQIFAEISAR